MNRFVLISRILVSIIFILLGLTISNNAFSQSKNLTVVRPDYGANKMIVKWSAPTTTVVITEYQVRRKDGVGAFGPWISNGLALTYTDATVAVNTLYSYQVKAKAGAASIDSSNIRANKIIKIWPVADGTSFNSENRNVLNGFNQAIRAGGSDYLHEGADLNGKIGLAGDYVKSPVGGIVTDKGGTGSNIHVNIEFLENGVAKFVQFNHLDNLSPTLTLLESLKPGDTLGTINTGIWSVNSSHTHFHYWTSNANFFGSTQDPFSFFDQNADKDPYGNNPKAGDSNGDGEILRFRKRGGTYFPKDKPVFCPNDIVVEVFDSKSSGNFNTGPKSIGYYVEKQEDATWVNAVKSSASPYLLIDNVNGYFNSNSTTADPAINLALHDRAAALKSTAPTTPADYAWEQWFTYMVTNTKGTDGKVGNLDSAQCWATDARNTVASDNGFAAGYDLARINEEAKFEDSKYRVGIRMTDWVNTPADYQSEVTVDNFLPYVKKVEMTSGSAVYEAQWSWGGGSLTFAPNTKSGLVKCDQDLVVKITLSEPMKEVSLAIAKISFSNTSTTPEANSKMKEWKFTVPKSAVTNAKSGEKIVLSIKGKDLADNELWGFASNGAIAAASIPKHKEDGTWTVTPPLREDTLHKFEIKKPKFEITTTKVSCKGTADGSATVNVTKGDPPYKYVWSNGQNAATANNLAPGSYQVIVSDLSGCDSIGTASVSKESNCPPDPFTIPVTAGGDPNDITGPAGFAASKWVSVNDVLPYTIRFENDPKIATAAVNKVVVTYPIDKMANMFSFRLGNISFRNFVVEVPPNTSHFFKHLNLVDSIGVYLDITAGLDVTKNQAFWIFQAFDSATGLPNTNPDLGFLLINDSINRNGEGAVSFSIKPKITAATGDSIKAYADIVFDVNATIRTNVAFNTIDAYPPASKIKSVTPLDAQNVQVAWKAHDDAGGSGTSNYKLLVSTNNGPYSTYADGITDTSTVFHVVNGNNYRLQTIAIDHVNNMEQLKPVADTILEIKTGNFFITPNYTSSTCVGNRLKISWRQVSGIAAISLQLSADSGKTFTTLSQNTYVSDSVYFWNIPATLAGNSHYIIRAVNSVTQLAFASSDYFLIRNTIHVSAGADRELCAGDSTLLGGSPVASNGIAPYNFKWFPSAGLSSDSVSKPYCRREGNYIIHVSDSVGCSNTDTVKISTHTLPNLFVDKLDSAYYTNSAKDTLYGYPAGGTFSGAGITGSVFNPGLAGAGTHTVTYTYTNEFGCPAHAVNYTRVFPAVNVLIQGLDSVYCATAGAVILKGIPAGGVFSGAGMINAVFYPALAGPGKHTISYTYLDSSGTSFETADTTAVYPLPLVSITGLSAGYYLNDLPVTLAGLPSGGTFAGAGIADSVFTPLLAGAGTHTITYTYINYKGCSNKATAVTTVNAVTAATVNGFITYDNVFDSPLGNTAVYLKNQDGSSQDTTQTDSTGFYSFRQVKNGRFILSAHTSIGWGGVNATDALIVKKYAVGSAQLTPLRTLAADVNLSSSVNATDALTISKRTVGLISSFPAGDWINEKDSVKAEGVNTIHNLKGICTGDVNGSYLPPTRSNKQTISLIYGEKINAGSLQDFYIPVKATASIIAGAITLGITYPADLITVKSVSSKAKGLVYNIENGMVKIAWADLIPVTFNKNDSIAVLRCSANTRSAAALSMGLLNGGEFADFDARVMDRVVLSVPPIQLNGITGNELTDLEHFSLLQNYPNPFTRITSIEYVLPEAAEVSLKIYNLLGISISEIVHASQTAGKYTLKYDGSNLPAGIYIYEIKVSGINSNFTQSRIMSISK
jgi:SprB repeat/Dockerin type I domain/Secretion system C-terminal sorting domain